MKCKSKYILFIYYRAITPKVKEYEEKLRKENENVKKEGRNQGKIIMNNTGGNIIYSKQKEQNEKKV